MLTELLKDLVAIDSSTKEGANRAVDYCTQWLNSHQIHSKTIENNGYKMLIAEIGEGDKTMIWNGHVDVVSGTPDQYFPRISEGKLYGRGAADMKAGVAAMMCAFLELKNKKLALKIQLQIVSDEEIGGFNCSGFLAEQGYRGDFVICAEPTQLGIGLQAKGSLRLDIDISGMSAHGSRPWEGVNAIEKAFEFYQRIKELPFTKEQTPLYDGPSINLAKIKGGDVYNKVPDACLLSLDIRYLPTQTAEDIIEQIKDLTGATVHHIMSNIPVQTDESDPFITLLRPVIEKHTKKDAIIFGQHGSADTVFYAAYGIPAIEFGPSGENWHGDREAVDLESIMLYQSMLIDFAYEFINV